MSFTSFNNRVKVRFKEYKEEILLILSKGRASDYPAYKQLVGQLEALENCIKLFDETVDEYEHGSTIPEQD